MMTSSYSRQKMANLLRKIDYDTLLKSSNGDILYRYHNDKNNKNIIGLIKDGKLSLLLEEIFSMSKDIITENPPIQNINIRNKDELANFIARSGLYFFNVNDCLFYAKYIGYKVDGNKKEKEYLYFYEKNPSTTRNFINNYMNISGREILRLNLRTLKIDGFYFKPNNKDDDEIIDITSSIHYNC